MKCPVMSSVEKKNTPEKNALQCYFFLVCPSKYHFELFICLETLITDVLHCSSSSGTEMEWLCGEKNGDPLSKELNINISSLVLFDDVLIIGVLIIGILSLIKIFSLGFGCVWLGQLK